ncbi:uncharacterized protein LOC107263833 isoform X2 [Cephus cinctus]|uniref:Uncharacterized protein LOC107263833 isoform X2 n=1 Tax=Cephus cinctus TaxID=211228 RepID=A0AAJ7RA53_CEPCN|nr:uncharacterized protein LOC107263833 isoform X2 [Cephus cinctus]
MVKVEGDIVDTHFNFSCSHVEKSLRMFSISIFTILVIATNSESVNFLTKCCDIDHVFNDNYDCVYRENQNQTLFHALNVTDISSISYNVCFANSTEDNWTQDGNINITWTGNTCLEILANVNWTNFHT